MNRIQIALLAVSLTATVSTKADLLVDRGLPTSNLNNAAGSDRSNVSWADAESSTSPSEYWVPGDSFSIGGSGIVSGGLNMG